MIRFTFRIRTRIAAPLAFVLTLAAACQPGSVADPSLTTGDDPNAVLFLTQESAAYMDALFDGKIVRDDQGCLRAQSIGSSPTVVWPSGFTLEGRDGGLHVKDRQGRVVGRIGGSFHIGGGHGTLDHANISAEQRQLAMTRCPGEVWIASLDYQPR